VIGVETPRERCLPLALYLGMNQDPGLLATAPPDFDQLVHMAATHDRAPGDLAVPSMVLSSVILAGTTGCEIRGGRWGGGAAAALGFTWAPLWLRGTVPGTGFRQPAGTTGCAVHRALRRPGLEAGTQCQGRYPATSTPPTVARWPCLALGSGILAKTTGCETRGGRQHLADPWSTGLAARCRPWHWVPASCRNDGLRGEPRAASSRLGGRDPVPGTVSGNQHTAHGCAMALAGTGRRGVVRSQWS